MENNFYKESISLVIPVYNEEIIIDECVRSSYAQLSKFFLDFEFIIIDDGSTDNTVKLLSGLKNEFNRLVVLTNKINMGIGPSLLRGLKYSSKNYIIHNGADRPFSMEDIEKVFPLIYGHDILVISRYQYSGYSLYRRIISFINLALLRGLFPLKLKDFNFIQIYSRKVISSIDPKSKSAGFLVPEILLSAHKLNFSIIETKHRYHTRVKGNENAGKLEEVVKSFIDMVKFWYRY